MNSLVALRVQHPQINTLQAFDQSQQTELQNKSTRMAQARQGLEWVGSMALGAMDGKLDGQADPQRWNEGLDVLAQSGVDKSVTDFLRGRPDLAPTIARASLDTMQQLSVANSDRDYQLALKRFDQQVAEASEASAHRAWQREQAMKPEPGFRMLSAEEAAGMGLPEGSWQVGPDNKVHQIGGSGQTINVGSEVGAIPQGYELFTDPESGARSLRPIPGGPVAAEQEAAASAAEASAGRKETTANVVVQDIERAVEQIKSNPALTTGVGAQLTSGIGGTPARDVGALLDTVKANAGFAELQAMRESSPTGGALGQVTERELAFLQSTIGSLEQSQSQEQLVRNLERVKEAYLDIIHGKGNRPETPLAEQSIDALLEKYR